MGGGLDILIFNESKKEYWNIQTTDEGGGKLRLTIMVANVEDIDYSKLSELYEKNYPIQGALKISNNKIVENKLLDNPQQFFNEIDTYVKNSGLLNFIKNKVPGTYCINHYTIIEE